MKILFQSHDDGAIYKDLENGEDSSNFSSFEVPDKIELTPEQVCNHNNDILDMLLRANQARLIDVKRR